MRASSIDEIEHGWDLQSSLVETPIQQNGCNSSSESAIYSPAMSVPCGGGGFVMPVRMRSVGALLSP